MSLIPPTPLAGGALNVGTTGFPMIIQPFPNITPFTYRDGLTWAETLESYQKWILDALVPHVDAQGENIAEAYNLASKTLADAMADYLTKIGDDRGAYEQLIADDRAAFITAATEIRSAVTDAQTDVNASKAAVLETAQAVEANSTAVTTALNNATAATQAATTATTAATNAITPVPDTINPNFTIMAKWLKAKNNADTGIANAKILCLGDSKTWGYPASPEFAWPALMRSRMITAAPAVPAAVLPGTSNGIDPSWTIAAPWAINFGPANGGLFAQTGNNTVITYKPPYIADSLDVWTIKGNGKAGVIVSVNGVNTTIANFDTTIADTWVKATIPMPRSATNVVTFKVDNAGAGVYLNMWADAFDSTQKEIRVANWGVSGVTTVDWVNATYSLAAVKAWAPDLTIIQLGTNDGQQNRSVADWTTAMNTLIDAAKISGDVLILSCAMSPRPAVATWEKAYRDAMPGIAKNKDVVFIDVLEKFNRIPNTSTLYTDDLHPNTRGQSEISRIISAGVRDL